MATTSADTMATTMADTMATTRTTASADTRAATASPTAETSAALSVAPSAPGIPALPLPDCQTRRLHTVQSDVLTVGTGTVPDPPWFVSDDPADGHGLDAAVITEIATLLGYSPGKVVWQVGAGPADLKAGSIDLLIGQEEIPDRPGVDRDWSTGYYDLSTAMVARVGTAAAAVTTTARLAALSIGAVIGSDDEAAARAAIPGVRVTSYPDVAAALKALSAGEVDALAVPTWRAVAEAQADSTLTVLGTLPTAGMQPPQLGIVLAAGSTLTACVSAAVDAMRVQGDLELLATTWIGDVPALT